MEYIEGETLAQKIKQGTTNLDQILDWAIQNNKGIVSFLKKVVSNRKQEIVKNVQSSELPIKIVFDVRDDNITIITVFPLKQRR